MDLINKVKKIVFVDEENTALSPFAEQIMKRKLLQANLGNIEVCSRGRVVLFAEPANPKMQEVAGKFDISIADHKACQLGENDFSPQTLVVVVDGNKVKVYEKFENAQNVFALKDLTMGQGDIALPVGGDLDRYEAVASTLSRLTQELADKITEHETRGRNMVYLGSDHAGYELKLVLKEHLEQRGYETKDVGCFNTQSCDYPDFAKQVAMAVAAGDAEKGVLVCGTGIGMSIAANKVRGVRAALVTDEFTAQMTREHNDANVVCMGARVLDTQTAVKLLDIFMDTPFSGEEKHMRRIGKIE